LGDAWLDDESVADLSLPCAGFCAPTGTLARPSSAAIAIVITTFIRSPVSNRVCKVRTVILSKPKHLGILPATLIFTPDT
jgi:hypothetical protein